MDILHMRMYLYFDYSPRGVLRWYVKVSTKGRRIGINEEYRIKTSPLLFRSIEIVIVTDLVFRAGFDKS